MIVYIVVVYLASGTEARALGATCNAALVVLLDLLCHKWSVGMVMYSNERSSARSCGSSSHIAAFAMRQAKIEDKFSQLHVYQANLCQARDDLERLDEDHALGTT